jgi:hypothetical protein
MAVAFLGTATPPARIIAHELVHAWFDLLGEGYAPPNSLQEGFARMIEYNHACGAEVRRWVRHLYRGTPGYGATFHGLRLTSIKQIVCVDYWQLARESPEELSQLVDMSFLLNVFLARLSQTKVRLRSLLPSLRQERIRDPDSVLSWIEMAAETPLNSLETSFQEFCESVNVAGESRNGPTQAAQ